VLADGISAGTTPKPSRNGTYLNGERLGPLDKMLLLPGDIIRLGHTELVVTSPL
jgi:pSer/pThr/pTyr-binding forkhead associated (FHA) protein